MYTADTTNSRWIVLPNIHVRGMQYNVLSTYNADPFTSCFHFLAYTLANSGFFKNFLHQGCVKSTVSWVFEDLKFKISEGCDQNWCFQLN